MAFWHSTRLHSSSLRATAPLRHDDVDGGVTQQAKRQRQPAQQCRCARSERLSWPEPRDVGTDASPLPRSESLELVEQTAGRLTATGR
ncbi:hypothetical protein C5E10_12600 [Pseudoclavibacter sp. RFBG4]|nr:hypothetical protein C5E10_12600 [Pseudoclavibacter sp. RFBG4]